MFKEQHSSAMLRSMTCTGTDQNIYFMPKNEQSPSKSGNAQTRSD